MNFLSKLIFIWRKPKIIIVTGKGRTLATEAIFQVLKQYFKVKKVKKIELGFFKEEILIFEIELKKARDFNFFIKNSQLPILVVTHVGEIPPEKNFFAGEKKETAEIRKLAKILPSFSQLVLNFDDETVREIADETNVFTLTFGFQTGADFRASDIMLNKGINFKINYKGNIVPVWLDSIFGKEQIYSALAAAAVGTIFDLNLVEISQALKFYKGLPGKMRLIEGIKNVWILDDSESATLFSMIEALEILGKIEVEKLSLPSNSGGESAPRKIAVLGDVLGIGKYTIEAHEAIGEKVAKTADLLFTIGERTKFIAQGAKNKGFLEEKVFQFDTIKEATPALKTEIKEGDLILVDGSTEMEMAKIVNEIKLFTPFRNFTLPKITKNLDNPE